MSTTTESSSGTPQDSSNGTLVPAYWNTYANALATSMGTSPVDAPIQDGTTSGEWDTSQGLASAVGGQDMHALQFAGAEVQPAISGSAVALEQGGGGSGTWASHPSAIGYRRQGYTTGGSHGGSGSMTVTIAAVAPEFDSGMNSGTDQDEMERLNNFGQGAEENPTVAQSQPIARAVQQTAVVGPGGEPLFVPGPTEANVGNSMGVGGYMGNQMIKENAGILGLLGILPPGVAGSGQANRSSPYSSALTPPPSGLKSRSLGNGDGLTRGGGPQTPPPPVTSPTAPVEQAPGSQIDPGQPATPDDVGDPSTASTSPAGSGDNGPQIAGRLQPNRARLPRRHSGAGGRFRAEHG